MPTGERDTTRHRGGEILFSSPRYQESNRICRRRDVGVGETKVHSVPRAALQLHNAVRRQLSYYTATVRLQADYLTCIMQQVSPSSPTAKGRTQQPDETARYICKLINYLHTTFHTHTQKLHVTSEIGIESLNL